MNQITLESSSDMCPLMFEFTHENCDVTC